MNNVKAILTFIWLALFSYLCVSFYNLSFDVEFWGTGGRYFFIVMTIYSLVFSIISKSEK